MQDVRSLLVDWTFSSLSADPVGQSGRQYGIRAAIQSPSVGVERQGPAPESRQIYHHAAQSRRVILRPLLLFSHLCQVSGEIIN